MKYPDRLRVSVLPVSTKTTSSIQIVQLFVIIVQVVLLLRSIAGLLPLSSGSRFSFIFAKIDSEAKIHLQPLGRLSARMDLPITVPECLVPDTLLDQIDNVPIPDSIGPYGHPQYPDRR